MIQTDKKETGAKDISQKKQLNDKKDIKKDVKTDSKKVSGINNEKETKTNNSQIPTKVAENPTKVEEIPTNVKNEELEKKIIDEKEKETGKVEIDKKEESTEKKKSTAIIEKVDYPLKNKDKDKDKVSNNIETSKEIAKIETLFPGEIIENKAEMENKLKSSKNFTSIDLLAEVADTSLDQLLSEGKETRSEVDVNKDIILHRE